MSKYKKKKKVSYLAMKPQLLSITAFILIGLWHCWLHSSCLQAFNITESTPLSSEQADNTCKMDRVTFNDANA